MTDVTDVQMLITESKIRRDAGAKLMKEADDMLHKAQMECEHPAYVRFNAMNPPEIEMHKKCIVCGDTYE